MLKKQENMPETGTKRKAGGSDNQCLPKKMQKNEFFLSAAEESAENLSRRLPLFGEDPSIL